MQAAPIAQICLAAVAGCRPRSVRNGDDQKVQVVGSKPLFNMTWGQDYSAASYAYFFTSERRTPDSKEPDRSTIQISWSCTAL